jgi:uncharacterized protein (TIGR01569 family)
VFLVAATAVAAGYSLLQAARCCVALAMFGGGPCWAWCVFSCDQALTYVLLTAVVAALHASVVAKRGQPELQWMGICAFCRPAGAIAAGLAAALLAFLSAFNLFRLYGSKS